MTSLTAAVHTSPCYQQRHQSQACQQLLVWTMLNMWQSTDTHRDKPHCALHLPVRVIDSVTKAGRVHNC